MTSRRSFIATLITGFFALLGLKRKPQEWILRDPIKKSEKMTGYPAGDFIKAGYVYAPYIPYYSTPTIFLDDVKKRKWSIVEKRQNEKAL